MITDLTERFEPAAIAPASVSAAVDRMAALELFSPDGPHTSGSLANLFLAVGLEHLDAGDQFDELADMPCQSALLTARDPMTGGSTTRSLAQDDVSEFEPFKPFTVFSLSLSLEDHAEAFRTGKAMRADYPTAWRLYVYAGQKEPGAVLDLSFEAPAYKNAFHALLTFADASTLPDHPRDISLPLTILEQLVVHHAVSEFDAACTETETIIAPLSERLFGYPASVTRH